MGKVADGLRNVFNTFISWLPEGANKANTSDTGNVAKSSPTLFDYDVFRINWEKIATLHEIDQMIKSDPRLKRANHVFASTAVRRGLSVKLSSSINEILAEKAQEIIDELTRKTQINSKLLPWARSLTKDGELYLNSIIDMNAKKIIDIKNLPALTMQRNENITGRFEDLKDAFRQIDPVSRQVLTNFPLFSINHIRYDHEAGQLYGNSKYLACRAVWKKLYMTEEDLVVRRRTRAVPRRLHSVGSDSNPGTWDDVETYKAKNNLTNPKVAAVTTDYFGNGLTSITDLNGDAHLDQIKDIEHLQELLMIGTGVPLHILGFGKNVNRDIVEDQKKQFEQDTQELRDLLEYGDDSPFSGLRAIFDLALTLQGIDPSLVEYNFMWAETDQDSVDSKVDRAVKLRAAQPEPLVSRKFALSYLGRDIGLENEGAIESEIEQIKEEMEEAKKEQEIEAKTLNPVKPSSSPNDKSTISSSGKPVKDAVNPLHSKQIEEVEKSLADDIRLFFKAVFKQMKKNGLEAKIKEIEKLRPLHDSMDPIHLGELAQALESTHGHCTCSECITDKVHEGNYLIDQKVLDELDLAWGKVEEENKISFNNALVGAYHAAGIFAFESANNQISSGVSTNFVHSGVKKDLEDTAGTRIEGIKESTRQLLGKQLSQAYENGESHTQWMGRIQSVMDIPDWRADMIARTETSFAFNKANLSAYEQAGVTKVRYLAVIDNRTCPTCYAAATINGDGIYNITDVPSLPRHPRCRCTTIAEF